MLKWLIEWSMRNSFIVVAATLGFAVLGVLAWLSLAARLVLVPVRTNYGSFRTMPTTRRKLLGRHIVADPEICHGKPTFLDTRIMVVQVLKQVAKGMPWDAITAEWRGAVTKDAIAEAVELAQRIFEDHATEYVQEPLPA